MEPSNTAATTAAMNEDIVTEYDDTPASNNGFGNNSHTPPATAQPISEASAIDSEPEIELTVSTTDLAAVTLDSTPNSARNIIATNAHSAIVDPNPSQSAAHSEHSVDFDTEMQLLNTEDEDKTNDVTLSSSTEIANINAPVVDTNSVHTPVSPPEFLPAFDRYNIGTWLEAIDDWMNNAKITSDFVRFTLLTNAVDDDTANEIRQQARTCQPGTYYEFAVCALPAILGYRPAPPTVETPSTSSATQSSPSKRPTHSVRPSAAKKSPSNAENNASPKPAANESDDICKQLHEAQRLLKLAIERTQTVRRPTIDDLTIGQLRAIVADANVQPQFTRRIDAHEARIADENANPNADALPFANPQWCWYHQKYGTIARQCRRPCSYRPPPPAPMEEDW